MIDGLIGGSVVQVGSDGSLSYVAAHIAAAHSLFNVANTLLFIPLLPLLAKLVIHITPRPATREVTKLQHLDPISDVGFP
ncbi:hypothetical protein ACFLZM_07930 [Thermodesulfobacteriota bacterium]